MKAKTQRAIVSMVVASITFLLLTLIGFDIYPLTTGNDALIVEQQAWLQVVRDEYLAKSVLILAYRPVSSHSQAISNLQVILPGFQQTQSGLLNGDTLLGLPSNPSDDVKRILQQAQSDYVPLVAALKVILAHPDGPVDPTEVDIVLLHDYPYSITMAGLATLLQQQAEAVNLHLIIIKLILKTSLIAIIVGYHFLSGRRMFDKLVEIEMTEEQAERHQKTIS